MTKRSRVLCCIGVFLAPIASFFAFWSAIFYAWMNANGSWSPERAAAWAYPCLALSLLFFGLFVWCAWRLYRGRSSQSLTRHSSGTPNGAP
jgi:uncharacterized membrane protein